MSLSKDMASSAHQDSFWTDLRDYLKALGKHCIKISVLFAIAVNVPCFHEG